MKLYLETLYNKGMKIPSFNISDKTKDIINSLSDAGCVVVKGVADENIRTKVRAELEPAMETSPAQIDDCLLYTSPSPRD